MVKIMVVEDDPTLSGFYRKGLEQAGYQVLSVSTCNEAINTLMREDIALLVLDMNLPDGSGEQVLDYLETEPALMSIPTIVLTGFTRYTFQATRSQVVQVLTKPVTAALVVKEVTATLAY
jgi:DNA-binding response OmpR family regulator